MQTPQTVQQYDLKLVYSFLRKVAIAGVLGLVVFGAMAGAGVIASTAFKNMALPGFTLASEDLAVLCLGVLFGSATAMRYVRVLVEVKKDGPTS